jgi:1-aminocyclopropane-1-carboxylate deaminase
LAATGKKEGFKTIGVVRGEELNENSNASLKYCSEQGMKLIFAERNLFNSGNIDDNFLKEIRVQNEPFHFIPLGGTDDNAIKSCAQIHQYIPENTKSIVCAVGSGGTFCGLALGLKPNQELLGISAVNDFSLIEKTKFHLNNYTVDLSRIHLNFNYTFSGFGKWNEDLMNFILTFRNQYKIGIEPVYTGKAMYALMDLLRNNKVEAPITFIHTGGMQAFPELIVH